MAEEALTAVLRLELSQFQQALQAATNQVNTFAQAVQQSVNAASQSIQNLSNAFQRITQTIGPHTQATQQASQAHQTFSQTINQTNVQLNAFVQQNNAAVTSINNVSQATQAASSSWATFRGVLGALGVAATLEGIVSSLRSIVVESVKAATQMQSLRASFVAITGSTTLANRELAFVRETAHRLGADFVSTAEGLKRFEAAARGTKLEGEESRKIFVALVEAMRVVGGTTDQTRRALLALEQMISKGKISAEELRQQLGEALPGSFNIMARAVGVSTAQLSDMLKAGELISDEWLPRFGAQLRKEFGPGVEEATKTAAATFARFANNIREISINIGNDILKFLKPILDTVNQLYERSRQAAAGRTEAREDRVRDRLRGTSVRFEDLTPDEIEEIAYYLTPTRLPGGSAPSPGSASRADRIISLAGQRAQDRILQGRQVEEDDLISRGGANLRGAVPFERQTQAIGKEVESLKQELEDLLTLTTNFPALKEQDPIKDALRAVKESIEAVNAEIQKSPGLEKALIPEIQANVDWLNQKYASLTQQNDAIEAQKKAAKELAQEDERHAKDTVRDLREREKAQEAFNEAQLLEAKAVADKFAEIQNRTTRQREQDEAQRERLAERETAKTIRELERQHREYEQFARGIEQTLSRAFENVLSGSRSIFDEIKRLFFRLLADLAAAAIARQVVIPAVVRVFGAGGSAAAVGGSAATVGAGGAGGGPSGSTNGTGGSGGVGFSDVTSILSGANSIYGGASGNSSTSITGLAGRIPAVQNFLDTALFSYGGTAAGGAGDATLATGVGLEAGISGPTGAAGAAGSTVTVGTVLGAAGAGIGAGLFLSQLNGLLGITDAIGKGGSGALAGAGGGALAGTIIAPGIGTAIGAALGALIGGLAGAFLPGGAKESRLDITGVREGRVGFNATEGIHVVSPFSIDRVRTQRIGTLDNLNRTVDGLTEAVNTLLDQTVGALSGLDPRIQEALIGPLNKVLDDVEASLVKTDFKGKGEELTRKIDDYFRTDLPKIFQDAFNAIADGIRRIDPVVAQFSQVIAGAERILRELNTQEQALLLSLGVQTAAIQRGLFTPAQTFEARHADLENAVNLIATGTPQQRLATIPIAQELIGELFDLSRSDDVLGQDPVALRQFQAGLVSLLESFNPIVTGTFGGFEQEVQSQIDLANEQINALIGSLGNLGNVDSVIQQSLGVLDTIRGNLIPFENQDRIRTEVEQALTIASVQSLASIDTVAQAQLEELRGIRAGLGGLAATGGQFVDVASSGDGDGGFARGTAYVPRTAFYRLHAGERVVNAADNRAGGGGETHITINVQGGGNDAFSAERIAAAIERRAQLGKTSIVTRGR